MDKKIITSQLLVAYSQCPRQAFLLLYGKEKGTPHAYVQLMEESKQENRLEYLRVLRQECHDVVNFDEHFLKSNHSFIVEATLKSDNLEAYCDILVNTENDSSRTNYSYEPTIIIGNHKIEKESRLALLFVSTVLGKFQKKLPLTGRIVDKGGKVHKLKLESGYKTINSYLKTLQEWLEKTPDEPQVILNKHCPTCQFYTFCREKAEKEDNLSLLDRMTHKAINRYNKKGIFTVYQLSYLFKPRKKRKRKAKVTVKHNLELQALAIREKKIYLEELPDLSRKPVEIFLDIEGIPDQCFHYLMGLLICDKSESNYYYFWADTVNDEEKIWSQLVKRLNEHPEAAIYHYGSYETKAIDELSKRYSTDCELIKTRLVNINSYIYGKVYFPTFSNRLKEIGNFLGASWTSPDASGIQALIWRYHWEKGKDFEDKQRLLTYNQEDCQALRFLIDELSEITKTAESEPNINFVHRVKKFSTNIGEQIHDQFESILKFAHADYNKNKIIFQKAKTEKNQESRKPGGQRGHQGHSKIVHSQVNKIICIPHDQYCPICQDRPLKKSYDTIEKFSIDLIFKNNGLRKFVIKYVGLKGYCSNCNKYFINPAFHEIARLQLFGHGFQAWVIYQRLSLRLSYRTIIQLIEELFDETVSSGTIANFINRFANYYNETEKILIEHILESPYVHVDETPINIQGCDYYVWVFTNGKYVVFKLTETREANIVHEFLSNYTGILISDFYPGYDSVKCQQQKCWSHLIRDLNDDLWQFPFEQEYEVFVAEVRNLILPIFETVEKYGLKERNLGKFRKSVASFYKTNITNKLYQSELVTKYQKRFERYRQSLFTFLEQDSIPWNNNMAERAIRHLAIQRKISGSFFESGANSYLTLLGVMQTCRFQEKSFLKFLLSEEKDIDKFKPPKHRKKNTPVTQQK